MQTDLNTFYARVLPNEIKSIKEDLKFLQSHGYRDDSEEVVIKKHRLSELTQLNEQIKGKK